MGVSMHEAAFLIWQVRIECEDDLWRHYARDKFWLQLYLMHDNATCIHPPEPGARLGPPGWGGAYAGSKVRSAAARRTLGAHSHSPRRATFLIWQVRCVASHDLRTPAQPDACNAPGSQPGTSYEPFDKFPSPT